MLSKNNMKIVRKEPAKRFGEAYAIGNGHIGAMVYGGVKTEKIELSENSFFSGCESMKNDNQPGASIAFQQMRELIQQGKYEQAHQISKKFYGNRNNYGTNLPVGSLLIDREREMPVDNYSRTLNIETGAALASWETGGERTCTESFASHVNNILFYQIAQTSHNIHLRIHFHSPRDGDRIVCSPSKIQFDCQALEPLHSDGRTGVCLYGELRIVTDGTVQCFQDALKVQKASYVRCYLSMETDFVLDGGKIGKEMIRQRVCKTLDDVRRTSCKQLRESHEADMRSLFKRNTLEIRGEKDEFVKSIPLMYQMGRYLLYSSCREDSKLPANLQGIWNDNVACRIGWTCDMHLDINTQMNYWPSEVTNLSCVSSNLFRWIKKLAVSGEMTAKTSYGYPGWAGEIVSNAWAYTAPYWATPLSPCPTGGVWILTQMWEHYQFTADTVFLEKEAMPVIEGAVRFFADYVTEDKSSGYFTSGPSISPENGFLLNNKIYYMSMGCTYEITMIRELFDLYQKACDVLQEDTELLRRVSLIKERLLPYRILSDGSIAEYNHDYPVMDSWHRHTSHLLGIFPFAQITPENEKLSKAAEVTIQNKITPEENWEDTGWARSMLALYEARLHNPKKAWYHISRMLENLLEPNGFIIHPPTRGTHVSDQVYELDGNTGLTSCIAEMLLQSHNGVVQFLPCLPPEWEEGTVRGLRARGAITVDIVWKNKKYTASLTADSDCQCVILLDNIKRPVNLKAKKAFVISGKLSKESAC